MANVIELMEKRRQSLGWSVKRLATEAGVHRTFLNRLRDQSSPPPRIRDGRKLAREDPRYRRLFEVLHFDEAEIDALLGQIEELQKGHPPEKALTKQLASYWNEIRQGLSRQQQARLFPVLYSLCEGGSPDEAAELLMELADVLSAQVADSPHLLGLLNLVYRSMGKPEE